MVAVQPSCLLLPSDGMGFHASNIRLGGAWPYGALIAH
jgi:hypothetical protein